MEARTFGMDPVQDPRAQWPVHVGGGEIRRLESKYRLSLPDDEWDGVVSTAAEVLSRCPSPAHLRGRTTGLVLGKVQSGKTLSYTALIALAIENGYRLIVVLAGTKNPLLEQTHARLFRDLEASRPALTPFKNPPASDQDVVRGVLDGGGRALIVVLKNATRVGELRRLLGCPELRNYPVLVVDDEGDEASLNTQFRKGRRSTVYNSIVTLRDSLPLHGYVAYTATPQPILLISKIDELSPDFCVLVEPGRGYCGGSVFFGANRDRYIRLIPVQESQGDYLGGVPDGLKHAIATFLVAGVIRHLREDTAWHSMLIHNSNLRASHQQLYSAVRTLMQGWRDALMLPGTDPMAADVLVLARDAYEDLRGTALNAPEWGAISEQLRSEVRLVEVWMVNSLPQGKDPMKMPFRLRNNILIGGNMLGRGLTIPDLAVTYLSRQARETNADTVEQRARWFGYKEPYLDICRIYLTQQLRDEYTELLSHEDDFWESLQRSRRQGLSVREWPRMLRLDMELGLRPTRPNVASYRQFRGSGWDIQGLLIQDPLIASQNVRVAREFFQEHPGEIRRYGNVEHRTVPACSPDDVISKLLARLKTEGTDWEKSYVAEYLRRLLLGNRLPVMEVLLMSNGEIRERTKDERGRVNPMQGRSPNREPSDPEFYPGDAHIHADRVQLQVHIVQVRGGGAQPVTTTGLALYVPPDDSRYDLKCVVRDEE